MFGSEFAWGIVLFAWLFGVALGAGVGGATAARLKRPETALVAALMSLAAAACVDLWVFRGARAWLGVGPGEFLALPTTVLAAVLFVSPTGALVGMAFPLACCVRMLGTPRSATRANAHPQTESQSTSESMAVGTVYALESAGSLIGGAAFSFWAVEHLAPIQTALICAALTAAACAGLLRVTRRRGLGVAGLGIVSVAALATAVCAGDALNDRLVQRRWRNVAPGYEQCAEVESKYQNLALGRREDQFTLYSDGMVSASFPDPYTFVPLAHFWMCQHPLPRKVLVLGGGAEGLLAEILRHPVDHIDYVEPDPLQIELIAPYLAEADRRALEDPRVTVHHMDARHFVKTQAARFDLVILRLPDPTSALLARFHTDEFYGELRRAMAPRSVLCTTAAALPGGLTDPWAEYLASIRATIRRSFPHVVVGWGNPAQILAATEDGLISTNPAVLHARFTARGVKSDGFDPSWFLGATDWLAEDKLGQRAARLDSVGSPRISTDLRPSIFIQRLALWESAMEAGSGNAHIIERLRSMGWGGLIGSLLAIAGSVLLYFYVRDRLARFSGPDAVSTAMHGSSSGKKSRMPAPAAQNKETGNASAAREPGDGDVPHPGMWARNSAVVLSIGTTGFATMALSIIWLFAFQNLYGYVYQRIGWIIAVFMGGLVIGCELVNRRSRHFARSRRYTAGAASPEFHDDPSSAIAKQSPATLSTPRERMPAPSAWASHPAHLTASLLKQNTSLWRWFVVVDGLLGLLCLSVPSTLRALGAVQSTAMSFVMVEWSISAMVALTGVLGGAAFALAGRIQLQFSARPGSAAGIVVGADHAGACLGALLSGVLLVPVFGTAAAAFLLAAIKLSSAAFLLLANRASRAV